MSARETYERPPRRRRAEVEAALAGSPSRGTWDAIEICLVAGPKDHGPGEHEYELWQRQWAELLRAAPNVTVRAAFPWPSDDDWRASRLVVSYFWHHDWTEANYAAVDAHLAAGGGVVAIHAAVVEDRDPRRLAERYGLAGQRPRLQFRHGALQLDATAEGAEIMRGLPPLELTDEVYWDFDGDPARATVLATVTEQGRACPMVWRRTLGPGRIFCCALGHFFWTFDDPLFRIMLLRGMAWAAGEPVERWAALATRGVELRD